MIHRTITRRATAVQAKWQNPVMKQDGKIDPTSINDMIVTFTEYVEWCEKKFGKPYPKDPTRHVTTLKTAWSNIRENANVTGR